MKTTEKTGNTHVLIETLKDPKADKRIAVYGSFSALLENEAEFNTSRYLVKKEIEEKGKYIKADFEKHIEVRRTTVVKSSAKTKKV